MNRAAAAIAAMPKKIDRALVSFHAFHNLVITLYDGRFLAAGVGATDNDPGTLYVALSGEEPHDHRRARR